MYVYIMFFGSKPKLECRGLVEDPALPFARIGQMLRLPCAVSLDVSQNASLIMLTVSEVVDRY